MSNRLKKESEEHDKTVGLIAKARFGFPTSDHPDWKTYTNHPDQTMGVTKKDGIIVYPDIVVVKKPENNLEMIGEVETPVTVNDEEASREWANYASLQTTFYLYVPNDLIDVAKKLLTKYSITISGLRGYYYDAKGDLNIINH